MSPDVQKIDDLFGWTNLLLLFHFSAMTNKIRMVQQDWSKLISSATALAE
jgi:hypothetical protein